MIIIHWFVFYYLPHNCLIQVYLCVYNVAIGIGTLLSEFPIPGRYPLRHAYIKTYSAWVHM